MKTKLQLAHTATPWTIGELKTSIHGTDFDGETIRLFDIPDHEDENQQRDAEFAVLAANNHYQLLNALKFYVKQFGSILAVEDVIAKAEGKVA